MPVPIQDAEPVEEPKAIPRRTLMRGAKGRKYMRMRPEESCRRCGMDQDEHTRLNRGKLNKHHVIPTSDGGHMTDPDNLYTLCYFCHKGRDVARTDNARRACLALSPLLRSCVLTCARSSLTAPKSGTRGGKNQDRSGRRTWPIVRFVKP